MSKNMPFVYFFYSCSFMLFLSSSHWFMLWISLELNSMMFLSLIVGGKTTHEMGGAVTYFMVQSTASLVLIYSMFNVEIMSIESVTMPKVSMLLALMVKLSSVPFHSWMPPVVMSLKSSFTMWLMLTTQKIMPLMMLMVAKPQISALILTCVCMSAIWGPLLNFSQSLNKNILAFSSISHTSWLICASVLCQESWLLYFFSYTIMLKFLAQALKSSLSQQNINMKQYDLITVFIVLISLGGLPPLMGFFPKIMILNSITMSMFSISMLLIMSSVMDLFIYTRMAYFGLVNKKSEMLWLQQKSKIEQVTMMIVFATFNLFIII